MKALRAEIALMKEDTIRIVKDVQDQCIQLLVDLSANFNSAVDLIHNKFQAIMRAEREERLQDQQLQRENSEVLQGGSNRHCEDINKLFVKYWAVRDQGNDLNEVQRVTDHWLGLAHDRLCKCPPNNVLPPLSRRPFPTAPEPISASPDCSNSGLSYTSVPIEGEDIGPGSLTGGPTSSDPGFILFHPAVIASSNPTTVSSSDSAVPPVSEGQVETPSPLTAQEDELITMELEDRLMREETERRMNELGRSCPGGVCQGRVCLRMSVNPYPHKMAIGKWSSQHATKSRKHRSVKQGGQRGRPFILPGEHCNPANYGRRGGGSSGAAEGVALLPAFDATSSSSMSRKCSLVFFKLFIFPSFTSFANLSRSYRELTTLLTSISFQENHPRHKTRSKISILHSTTTQNPVAKNCTAPLFLLRVAKHVRP